MKKWLWILPLVLLLAGCAVQEAPASGVSWQELEKTGSMPLSYATGFTADYYGDYTLISISEAGDYLLVPEGKEVPAGLPENTTVLQEPVDKIYLAATSAMDLYRAAGAMDAVRLSSLDASGWYIPEARQAMEDGRILYAGKYSAPDYERIFAENCTLAVESTMIYHTPEVKEQLERLGIPVLVERSSYESHPLGRMEWMKLHGLLAGKEAEARKAFDAIISEVSPILEENPKTGLTVAFFSVNSTGTVTVRKGSDYVANIIRLAGGEYLFSDLTDDAATATMNMQMEVFFDRARDCDVLIYNSTTAGELQTLEDLYAQSPLFRQFRAVETGNVFCTGKNLFQETTALGKLLGEIHGILTESPDNLTLLHRLT